MANQSKKSRRKRRKERARKRGQRLRALGFTDRLPRELEAFEEALGGPEVSWVSERRWMIEDRLWLGPLGGLT